MLKIGKRNLVLKCCPGSLLQLTLCLTSNQLHREIRLDERIRHIRVELSAEFL